MGSYLKKNYNKVLLRCLQKDNVEHTLTKLHDGLEGGHYCVQTTTHKVLRECYYWPTLLKDAHAHAQKFQICQVNAGRERRPTFPL